MGTAMGTGMGMGTATATRLPLLRTARRAPPL
jgi:hypothetical protein